MTIFHFFLCSAALAVGTQAAPTPEMPEILKERGLSQAAYEALLAEGLISSVLRAGGPGCLQSDDLTFQDKAVLAETVVRGRIVDVTYLYAQGGPYRALYRIQVSETLKGEPLRETEVLSKYGPTRRDHRRWKHNPARIVFQEGDGGIFFLTGKNIRDRFDMVPPEAKEFVAGKVQFINDIQGVYLLAGDKLNEEYMAKSGKRDPGLDAAKLNAGIRRVGQIALDGGSQ